ncbi:MAG: universal stress protein [Burkholderiaceae bacterium]
MFKRILLPTDGSRLSKQAVESGVRLARQCGAAVVGIHVVAVPQADRLEAWMHVDPHYEERRQALFDRFADEYLSFISACALAEGVPCTVQKVQENEPYAGIVRASEEDRCDLIYMASHGWSEGQSQLLGSVTHKVLHASTIPVLVYKPGHDRHAGG